MTRLTIQILPDRVIFKTGTIKPDDTPINTYRVNGPYLLVKTGDDVFYVPIYVYDKNTLFANGVKLIRSEQNK